MVSFRGQKKLEPRPDWSPLGVLIQNFQRASPPLSYAESPPPPRGVPGMAPVHPKISKMASGTDFWILLTCQQNLG